MSKSRFGQGIYNNTGNFTSLHEWQGQVVVDQGRSLCIIYLFTNVISYILKAA